MHLPVLLLGAAAVYAPATDEPAWVWDQDSPICALRQRTASPVEWIEIGRTPGNEETEIKIKTTIPSGSHVHEGRFPDATLGAGGGGAVANLIVGPAEIDGRQLYAVTPDPAFLTLLSTASALDISHEKIGTMRVPLRFAAEAIQALQGCEDKKMKAWGIDPAVWRGLRKRPIPLEFVRDRFRDLDYPPEALAASAEADAIIRLDVMPDGTVGECRSLNAGRYKGFERASCAVLKGARFQAAIDATGIAVAAPYVVDVRFRVDE
jgi:TonB family protein